jgi:putative salt-induced outer membrane protein YdiY
VTVKWNEVSRIRADKPLKALIHGEARSTLRDFFVGGAQLIEVTELSETTPVSLSEVQAINLGSIHYQGNVSIGGNSTHGNTETQAVNAAARIVIRAHRQRLSLEAKYNYGEANQAVTARNSLGSAKYDYFITKKIYLTTSGLLEKDTFQQLNLRATLGAGIGYQFLESAGTKLSADIGMAYVNEHFTTAPSTQTESSRWSLRFEHALVLNRLSIFHKHDGFYDLDHGNALRVLADQGIRVTVYQGLFVNLEYDLRVNTQPAPGRKQVDESLIFGIGYQFQ